MYRIKYPLFSLVQVLIFLLYRYFLDKYCKSSFYAETFFVLEPRTQKKIIRNKVCKKYLEFRGVPPIGSQAGGFHRITPPPPSYAPGHIPARSRNKG